MPEWIGQTIGKVRVDKYLARGGMAEVYLGTHLTLERPVAIKVMHSYIEADPELLTRFEREARVVAGLRHPNIVQIFDFDAYENHPFIVMEFLQGPSLAAYLRRLHENEGRLSLQQVTRLLRGLANALDYAHAHNVVHRDVKPANVILHNKTSEITVDSPLTNETEPILTDFGLVRLTHTVTQTASGLISGTPAYMSPEQARGDKVDYHTDIYSLGVVLYEMLAGRVPFEGDSTMAVIYKHIHEPPPPIPGIAEALQKVIDRALAKDPGDRYQTCRAMLLDYLSAIGVDADADATHTRLPRTTQAGAASNKRNQSQAPILIGAAIFACVCLSVLLASALGLSALSIFPRLKSSATEPSITQSAPAPPDSGYGSPMPMDDKKSLGVLRFQDGTAPLDQITISASLPPPAQKTQYEAWLIVDDGEQRKSLGVLAPNASGQFVLTYVDPESRNMLDGYNRMEITIEPSPDDSPNASDQVAYSSAIPMGSLMHIRHLLVSIDETPNHIGMAVGLVDNTTLIKKSADAMLEASTSGNTKGVRSNAEAIINLIAGKKDAKFYKDWNADGKIDDPGDGFGLLLNGEQAGYVGGVIDHAELAAKAPDSTPEIRMHTEHVIISAKNVEDWATQLRDIAVRIEADPTSEADIRSAVALANQMFEGIDINGNESIDPIPGEGGAVTAYQHADYMSDIPILPGVDQIPASGQ